MVKYMSALGAADHFMVDLTIARGLDYYTGTVYETVMRTIRNRLHLFRGQIR